MLAPLEVMNVEAVPCNECGTRHQFRISITGESAAEHVLHGFFSRCPVSMRRSWFVITVPVALDGTSRLVEVGPADDPAWEPMAEEEGIWSLESGLALAEAAVEAAVPSRGTEFGGFRAHARAPEVLRRALGCPHFR